VLNEEQSPCTAERTCKTDWFGDGTELKRELRLKKRGESTENSDVVQVGRKDGVSRAI